MRIQFTREGGFAAFPGLSKPITIDTATLPRQVAAPLEQLVESTQFFTRPAEINQPPAGAADYRQYTITVEDGGRRHTVRLTEPVTDPQLEALLDAVQAAARSPRTNQSQ